MPGATTPVLQGSGSLGGSAQLRSTPGAAWQRWTPARVSAILFASGVKPLGGGATRLQKMNMPGYQPSTARGRDGAIEPSQTPALSPQACGERCRQAFLGCLQTPDPVRCILDLPASCVDCLP